MEVVQSVKSRRRGKFSQKRDKRKVSTFESHDHMIDLQNQKLMDLEEFHNRVSKKKAVTDFLARQVQEDLYVVEGGKG